MIDLLPFIKGSCHDRIVTFYDRDKQTNINELQGYTQQQKDTMWAFINACRQRSNDLEVLYQNNQLSVEQIDYSDIVPGD